jgi:hypothetical protein
MIKRKITLRILVTIIIIFLVGCFYLNTNLFIRGQEWKYRDGGSVGDWIKFDDKIYGVRGRTVYKNNIAMGKVIFCLGKMLIIKEIATGEKGYYINKTTFKF